MTAGAQHPPLRPVRKHSREHAQRQPHHRRRRPPGRRVHQDGLPRAQPGARRSRGNARRGAARGQGAALPAQTVGPQPRWRPLLPCWACSITTRALPSSAACSKAFTLHCREVGYHLVVESLHHDTRDLQEQVERMVMTLRPDGMILTPPCATAGSAGRPARATPPSCRSRPSVTCPTHPRCAWTTSAPPRT